MVSGRRRFLLGITAPLALACGAAWPARRVFRIGILLATPMDKEEAEVLAAELKRRGWEEDGTVVFFRRAGTLIDPASMNKAARELVELKVDLILTYPGSAIALAALKATSTIPIVFFASSDPVGQGLIGSLARPGRNATGSAVPVFDVMSKNIQLLAEATGKLSKLAVLYTPESVSWPQYPGMVSAIDKAGRDLGIAVRHAVVGADVAQTLQGLINLRTASALGITIPQGLLVRATTPVQ